MEPKNVIRALVEAYNAKSLDGVMAHYQPDASFWDPFHRDGVQGADAIRELVAGLFAAYPDERMEIVTLAAEDRHVVAEFRSALTRSEGSTYELPFTEVFELRAGRIASCRVYLDPNELSGNQPLAS